MRTRSISRRLLTSAAVLTFAMSASGCAQLARRATHTTVKPPSSSTITLSSAERLLFDNLNAFRAQHGLKALPANSVLMNKARSWARSMAGGVCGRNAGGVPMICHSNLTNGITVSWSWLAENVGAAAPKTNVGAIATGFRLSKLHAENILSPLGDYVGVGVAYSGNTVYVAEEFMARP